MKTTYDEFDRERLKSGNGNEGTADKSDETDRMSVIFEGLTLVGILSHTHE